MKETLLIKKHVCIHATSTGFGFEGYNDSFL